MISANRYPWNFRVDVEGVTLTGPGMESQMEAEAILNIVENADGVSNGEVFSQ